jgi:hypothetical protein
MPLINPVKVLVVHLKYIRCSVRYLVRRNNTDSILELEVYRPYITETKPTFKHTYLYSYMHPVCIMRTAVFRSRMHELLP